jgi:hypothetical protein
LALFPQARPDVIMPPVSTQQLAQLGGQFCWIIANDKRPPQVSPDNLQNLQNFWEKDVADCPPLPFVMAFRSSHSSHFG